MPENQNIQNKKLPLKFFIWEVFLFSITLFLGIATAFQIKGVLKTEEISVAPVTFWQVVYSFIIGTLFVLAVVFLIKSKSKKGKIFKILFIFTIFWGGLVTLDVWLGSIFYLSGEIFALFLIIFLIYLWFKEHSVLIHNICLILGIIGACATLGLRIEPFTMLLLLAIFSVYDFIAVYKTKHMVKMATEMIESKAILGFVIPQQASGFKGDLKELKIGGPNLILGGGDIAFPLLFCTSLLNQSLLFSLIVAVFSIIGLFFSFLIFKFQKERKAIPALPPIALFCILGYLITLII